MALWVSASSSAAREKLCGGALPTERARGGSVQRGQVWQALGAVRLGQAGGFVRARRAGPARPAWEAFGCLEVIAARGSSTHNCGGYLSLALHRGDWRQCRHDFSLPHPPLPPLPASSSATTRASAPQHGRRWRVRVHFFVCLSLGFLVSYIFRGVNSGFAPPLLTREMGLRGAADLGPLTSFISWVPPAAQSPAGLLLDRFGPRRTEAALLCWPPWRVPRYSGLRRFQYGVRRWRQGA
ncbi:hypothetical protein ACU4GD_24960 [Cupriavidus basilensis]